MGKIGWQSVLLYGLLVTLSAAQSSNAGANLGVFTNDADIGVTTIPGNATHDSKREVYALTLSAGNTWFRADGFHYLWKPARGDLSLTAVIAFPPINDGRAPAISDSTRRTSGQLHRPRVERPSEIILCDL